MKLFKEYINDNFLEYLNGNSDLSAYKFNSILSIKSSEKNKVFFLTLDYLDIETDTNFEYITDIFVEIDTIDPMRLEFKKLNSIFSDIIWNLPKKQFSFDDKSPDLKSYIMNQIILSIEKDINLNLDTILIDFDIILNNGKLDFDFTFDSKKY